MSERQAPGSFLRNLKNNLVERFSNEDNQPHLYLSESARASIAELILRPNPKLCEASFIGVGDGDTTDIIYTPDGNFSLKAAMTDWGATTDPEELQMLYTRVVKDGRKDNMILYGHLHPSGTTRRVLLNGDIIKTINNSREALLYPSSGDIQAVQMSASTPGALYTAFEAIAANTEYGPCLRIYRSSELIKAKKNQQVWKIPHQTIRLT